MSDVFISYSHRDMDFVRHLFDQLTARDRELRADWQDILPATADGVAEIYRGIESANIFQFVINHHACECFQFNSRFDWLTQDNCKMLGQDDPICCVVDTWKREYIVRGKGKARHQSSKYQFDWG